MLIEQFQCMTFTFITIKTAKFYRYSALDPGWMKHNRETYFISQRMLQHLAGTRAHFKMLSKAKQGHGLLCKLSLHVYFCCISQQMGFDFHNAIFFQSIVSLCDGWFFFFFNSFTFYFILVVTWAEKMLTCRIDNCQSKWNYLFLLAGENISFQCASTFQCAGGGAVVIVFFSPPGLSHLWISWICWEI